MATATLILPVHAAIGDPTNPPAIAFTAANRPYLLFDDTTDELCLWTFELPGNYASGLAIRVHYSMASATANNVAIRTEVQAIADGEDIDDDAWSTVEKSADATVPGTAGLSDVISDALGTPTVAANDYIALRLGRENATSGSNATGDMEVWAVSLTYTTT
jgi:hypothetical protein